MTLPTLLFAFILATVYGAGFHLWQGGNARRLLLYLLAGWLGFALGHILGEWLGIRLLAVGALNTFTATLGSAIALFAARLLALNESAETSK